MSEAIGIYQSDAVDIQAVMALVVAAEWPHRAEDIEAAMTLGHTWLARDNEHERLAGIGVWWDFGTAAGRIGLVIVSADYQGRGIGRSLVEHLLADADPRALMLLSTNAGQSLYGKLGFRTIGRAQRHQGHCRREPMADPRIRMTTRDDHERLSQLDHMAVGARRGDILAHLFQAGHTRVLSHQGEIVGYAVERPFGLGSVVGPIVAASETDAIALFNASVRPGFVRVDRPMEAALFGQHLTNCGLAGDEVSDVMVLGEWPALSGPAHVFAMAGHAWG